jgi:hypothetical protein
MWFSVETKLNFNTIFLLVYFFRVMQVFQCCYEFLTLGFSETELKEMENEEINNIFSKIERQANLHQIQFKELEPQILEQYIVHKIEKEDTLESLSLKYDVSIGHLKEANAFTGNSLSDFYEPEILIPKSAQVQKSKRNQEEKKYLLEKFSKGKHCSKEVAKKLLEKNDWNLKKADEAFNKEFNKNYSAIEN